MIRNRLLLKSLTAFFIVEMLVSTVLPTFSWALTAGPTAPEFSSFEPVDTTDMVNLATGDFVYNTPILEVPGPAGGYPLSLSYHAGIRPEQEASWVGLGFTLNPGAINRTVNGFADDNINVRRQVQDYWQGGTSTTKTYSIGLNLPIKGVSTSLTVARTQDTFKGFSTNAYGGIHINPVVVALNASQRSGGSDNGSQDAATGLRGVIAEKGMGTLISSNSIDISISSNGVKASVTVAGHTFNQQNNNAGNLSSFTNETDKGTLPLPGNVGYLSLKDLYTRYWSDQTDALFSFGSLYSAKNDKVDHFSDGENDYKELRSFSNDIYNLYDYSAQARGDVRDEADPVKQIGGSLPSFDQYHVSGQGIGGLIEPYIFENGDMRGQNSYYRDPVSGKPFLFAHTLRYNSLKQFAATKKVDFRFKNDFSNSLTIAPATITEDAGVFGLTDQTITADLKGFDNGTAMQKLEGSKHIDWYTNQQILDGSAKGDGFIDCYTEPSARAMTMDIYDNYLQPEAFIPSDKKALNGKPSGIFKDDHYNDANIYDIDYEIRFRSLKARSVSLADRIGGFKITNQSGVTYHYALPVYNYNEYTRLKMKKPNKGAATITEIKNDEPYAYTWLLTAITGPDYVDRGQDSDLPNGILDESDFGYWVKFDYGKWTDSYQWRTPHSGYVSDIESEYETFSYGIKELYYLDAIETKSHKAFFIKSKRKDGRGVTSRLEGGSKPRKYLMRFLLPDPSNELEQIGRVEYSVSPVSSLKLDAVYLFDKKNLDGVTFSKALGAKYNDFPIDNPKMYPYVGDDYTYENPQGGPGTTIKNGEDFVKVKYHNGNLVYDDGDLDHLASTNTLDEFKKNASRIIEFNTDYSLAPGVDNSIGYASDFTSAVKCIDSGCAPEDANLDFEWPSSFGTACVEPFNLGLPVCCDETDVKRFYSDNPLAEYVDMGTCPEADDDLMARGSAISYIETGKLTLKKLTFLGHGGIKLLPSTTFGYDKNPSYNSQKYDDWGFYKSDYTDAPLENYRPNGRLYNESRGVMATKKITAGSSKNVDAWSLSSVKTPLGSSLNIEYEPNTYSQAVYNDYQAFSLQKVERFQQDLLKVVLKEKGLNLKDYFTVGGTIGIRTLSVWKKKTPFKTSPEGPNIFSINVEVTSIGNDFLVVYAPAIYQSLKPRKETVLFLTTEYTPYFIAGAIVIPEPSINKFGGGCRVKELSIRDFGGHRLRTQYFYNKPGTDVSSGVTSYKPYNAIGIHYPTEIDFFSGIFNDKGNYNNENPDEESKRDLIKYKTQFQKWLNDLDEKILAFGREAPAPGVVYEYVTTKSKYDEQDLDKYTIHRFQVFNEDMVSVEVDDYGDYLKQKRNVTIKNEAGDVGNLLSEVVYSTHDDMMLYEKKYGYLYDDEDKSFEAPIKSNKQGVVNQSFHKYITIKEYHWRGYEDPDHIIAEEYSSVDKAVVTRKEERSNAITSVEEKNFKTGASSISENHKFDFFTGAVLKTITTDQYNNRYLTETIPAYTLKSDDDDVYAGMGIKLFNPSNKGMLTQNAATYSYRLGASDVPVEVVSAEAQTWSKTTDVLSELGVGLSSDLRQKEIWRKKANYYWKGDDRDLNPDGHYPVANFQEFNFKELTLNTSQWQKSDEIRLYDVESHALEADDINGNFAATKMDARHMRVYATALNSHYNEFAFSGAEDEPLNNIFGGGIKQLNGAIVTKLDADDLLTTHTGNKAIELNVTGAKTFQYSFSPELNQKYHASVWANSQDGRLFYDAGNGAQEVQPSEVKKAGSWYLISADITDVATGATLEIWCETVGGITNFDDFRVHPLDAAMTSYVYNQWGELSHILDNNNLYTEYRYDEMGRLKETFKERLNVGNAVHLSVGKYKATEVIYNYRRKN